MKSIITALILLSTSFASAATPEMLQNICETGVRAHPTKPGFWHIYRPSLVESSGVLYATQSLPPTSAGSYAVVKVDAQAPGLVTEVLRFENSIRDLEVAEGQLWVLFADRLLGYDLITFEKTADVATGPAPTVANDEAQALVVLGGMLVIAHGEKGAVFYFPSTKQMLAGSDLGLQQTNGHRSKVIDVARVDDKQVAFAVEGVTVANNPPFPFNGVLLWDLQNNERAVANYDRKGSGVLSNAVLQVRGDQVLINNWGILHQTSLSGVRAAQPVLVNWTPVYFEVNGQRRPGELLGDLLAEDNQILACAQTNYPDPVSGQVIRKAVVYQGRY